MIDLREYADVVKSAVARERRCDQNWDWKVHSVGKGEIKFDWGYLSDFLKEKAAHFVVKAGEDEDIGRWAEGIVPNGHKVILFIGEKHWDDCRTFGEGIACAIHSMAQYAHSVY